VRQSLVPFPDGDLVVVAIIGAGVVGSAVARSLVRSRWKDHIIVTDVRVDRLKEFERHGVTITTDNRRAAKEADIVILCVKPRDVGNVLEEIRNEVKGKLIISMAASVSLDFLRAAAPEARLARAMPNLGILVQESFTAFCTSADMPGEDKSEAVRLLSALGKVVEVDERHMDAITALSGCSPAYLSVIMEAMVQAGLEVGLPGELALTASAQTMVGTGKLVLEARKQPSEIKAMVATPGGVTEEGLKELVKVPVQEAVINAVKAGAEKSRKISKNLVGKVT